MRKLIKVNLYKKFILMNFFEGLQTSFSNRCPKSWNAIKLIGFVVVLKKILKLVIAFYKLVIRKKKNLKNRYGAHSWAFVTGSSEGIGKAFAHAFAKDGFNIILCARTLQKLQACQKQIIAKYPEVRVEILQVDFKRVLQENYIHEQLAKINHLDVSILVNNVGVDVLEHYCKLPEEEIIDLIKVNCFPMSILCHHYIPIFQERKHKYKKKSAIINVSSMAAEVPMPLHNVYSASKAYVDFLSRALSYEYKEIDIVSLRPSEVSTPMTLNKQTDILTITADQCAEGFLHYLGYQTVTNGFWTHQFQGWLYSLLPQSVFNYFWLNHIGPDFMEERKKANEKKKKEKFKLSNLQIPIEVLMQAESS